MYVQLRLLIIEPVRPLYEFKSASSNISEIWRQMGWPWVHDPEPANDHQALNALLRPAIDRSSSIRLNYF